MNEPGVGPVPSKTSSRFIDHLHRPAALAAEDRRDRLQIDGDLAAEAAADLARHDRALARRESATARPFAAGRERALRGGPDRQVAVLVPQRGGDVRLDVALVNAGGLNSRSIDHVGLLETLVDVALLEVKMSGDVARLVFRLAHRVGEDVVVQNGRIVLHRVEHPGHAGSSSYSTLIFAAASSAM